MQKRGLALAAIALLTGAALTYPYAHAQDKATTREVLDQIGDKPLNRAWDNQFESCRRWARGP